MKKRFWSRRVQTLMAVAAVLAVLVTLGAALRSGRGDTGSVQVFSAILTPLRSGLRALDREAVQLYNYLYRYEALEAENEALRQELAQIRSAADEADRYRRENQRLRELLGLSQESGELVYTAAQVVSWDSSLWESRVTLNRGTADGIETGMCTITSTGQVVGLVTDCGKNWATVSTVYDVSIQLSARMESYSGVVQAVRLSDGSTRLQLGYLPSGASVRNGTRVVTAGSEKYPGGLLLGTVSGSGLDESGISRHAMLTAELEPSALEQVFVITDHGVSSAQ